MFSNDFLLQWGKQVNTNTSNHKDTVITFPIGYTTVCVFFRNNLFNSLSTDAQVNYSNSGGKNLTLTTCTVRGYAQTYDAAFWWNTMGF